MQTNPVGWFEIYVEDMQRAKKFYESVFGIKLEEVRNVGPGISGMWAFPMKEGAPGAAGALVKMEDGPSGNAIIVYFACNDCATEAAKVPSNGGKIMKEKFAAGDYGYISIVTDTEGNAIGLHSKQ
jgi:predicted enzyme related to lactoylglutathione lyase